MLAFGLLWTGSVAYAQQRNVSGTVTDIETGEAVPGVNVLVKSTTQGTVTDIDGKYNLTVTEDDAVLVFSYIGYKTQEVAVNGQSTLNVGLTADISSLQEVVVVGYGTQKKSDLTSAVAVVDPQDLLSVKTTSVAQQLQGRAPGVTVTNSNVPGQVRAPTCGSAAWDHRQQ